ncbi:MAG TPA: ribose-5-phosphate isomerase [Propionicimonas sp.]|jgi:ribose 5-phosphate isomerase B|uniref:ribose-5-phosphate isomerase n=1 Tax=Propionicimonas sp. TaxID=1955623 RepID=UPI002F3FEE30
MRVHLGSDHAGWELKTRLVEWLVANGHEAVDHGPGRPMADDDYPVYCLRAAAGVAADADAGIEALGVVIGGSGNGEQISANKVRGIRAALAWSTETARLAREHNDAQVLAIGARLHSPDDALGFVATFLATPFSGDPRHARRIAMLGSFEDTGDLPPLPAD